MQLVQLDAPVLDEKVPARHWAQTPLEVAEAPERYEPAAHTVQGVQAAALTAGEYPLPTTQSVGKRGRGVSWHHRI